MKIEHKVCQRFNPGGWVGLETPGLNSEKTSIGWLRYNCCRPGFGSDWRFVSPQCYVVCKGSPNCWVDLPKSSNAVAVQATGQLEKEMDLE